MKATVLGLIASLGIVLSATAYARPQLTASDCIRNGRYTCGSTITVYGESRFPVLKVTVSLVDRPSEDLFACFTSEGGSQYAPWIQPAHPAVFHLYGAYDCYGSNIRELDRLIVR